MTFQEALRMKARLESDVTKSSARMQTYPRLSNGRVSDNTRLSYSYSLDRVAYLRLFKELRDFNAWFVKTFKAEYREHRRRKTG